jgi:hypothetical protein
MFPVDTRDYSLVKGRNKVGRLSDDYWVYLKPYLSSLPDYHFTERPL